MEPSIYGALRYLDQIMVLQNEIDQVNEMECNDKFKLTEKLADELRWDEENECLRQPCITPEQERLFDQRKELVKLLPDFWSTALFANLGLVRYMNKEERKVFKYLKSVDVIYHGDAKSGYTIQLDMYENPYFENLTLTKTFRFSCKGISSESGTEIRWMKDKDIEVFADKGSTQSRTDMPSFFKWFGEASEKRDVISDEIVMQFWPKAHTYYFTGTERRGGKETQMLTEENRARKKFKGEEIDISGTLSELMAISDKLRKAGEQATNGRRTVKEGYGLELAMGERKVHKKCESLRRSIYNRRNGIIKNIHSFWLIAFMSHYALHRLVSKEDQKILKFLNSVDVEETEDEEGVVSGYTITLNFDANPYFKNDKLKKTISYTVMRDDPVKEYSDSEVNICVSNIEWKDGMDITTRYPRGFADRRSFFTWFSDLGCVEMEAYDEVADLIKQDFWPNAGKYFVNGNLNDEKEVDLVGISKMMQYTTSLRACFI